MSEQTTQAHERPLAVVFTFVPSDDDPTSGEVFYTAFDDSRHDDPLSFAHRFRKSEEARGDFPGAIWTVTGNDAAAGIRIAGFMASMGFNR